MSKSRPVRSKRRRFLPDKVPNLAEHCRFRSSPRPSANLPFGVRSVGRAEYPAGEGYDHPPRNIVHLFWGVSGAGTVVIAGRKFRLCPEHAVLFLPGERQCYWAGSKPWRIHWLSLDGALAAALAASLGRGRAPWHAGPCPLADFAELDRQIADPTPDGEREACATAFRIVMRAAVPARPAGPDFGAVARSLKLVAGHLADPELGVKWLARELGWNRSSFCRTFRAEKGLPPSEYIAALRLQEAVRLLLATPKSIAEVAAACGFRDPAYFCKAFRRAIGDSPSRFRTARLASTRAVVHSASKR
ncbi:MAG TPA: AraC family transcriptional regulator [Planctomycetota bacterium]|nr:AraC family transcriptional regulator [Planctomycetota bacterium]